MRVLIALLPLTISAADPDPARWIEAQGGEVVRENGVIVEVSLARTWATDNDLDRVAQLKTLRRLDLSFTYVTDAGIEKLQALRDLEELNLDTAEFLTDASASHLRANRKLRKLSFRGVDITDVGVPFLATLTGLRSLDMSHTMLGDVGVEMLSALAELEDLNLSANRITGVNFHALKLLPKLKRLSFGGIQRRNGNACWTPTIVDADLEPISRLTQLEELHLGIGLNLGTIGVARRGGNCQPTGGIRITDAGLRRLASLRNLRRLDISGHKITPAGLDALRGLPLERLSLWNCTEIADPAAVAAMTRLVTLDLSLTPAGDAAMAPLAKLAGLRNLYLTDTNVTATAVEAFRKQRPDVFVSWARRPPSAAKQP